MRKALKILHTVAAAGLIGGLACYMVLLLAHPQDTPASYAGLRQAIGAIGNYLLIPSLGLALVSGLFSMAVHAPFVNQGWAWLKAGLGILMFRGVLMLVGSMADYAAVVARRIADGEAERRVLDTALAHEWQVLGMVMALSVANVVLGVWRPRFAMSARPAAGREPERAPRPSADHRGPAATGEGARRAA